LLDNSAVIGDTEVTLTSLCMARCKTAPTFNALAWCHLSPGFWHFKGSHVQTYTVTLFDSSRHQELTV
jgi:hypothetical protein